MPWLLAIAGATLAIMASPKAVDIAHEANIEYRYYSTGSSKHFRHNSFAYHIWSGESKNRGYNDWNNCPDSRMSCSRYNASTTRVRGNFRLTSMSIHSVLEWGRIKGRPGGLFASGFAQWIPETLRFCLATTGVSRADTYDEHTQNRLFAECLTRTKRPAIYRYVAGNGNITIAGDQAAWEWASIKSPITGKVRYCGRGANGCHGVSHHKIKQALMEAKAIYQAERASGKGDREAYAIALGLL